MKKLLLVLVLLLGFNGYSQQFETEKKNLNKELQTELNKDYGTINNEKVKELRKKLTSLNETIKENYIDSTKTVVYDFQKKEYIRSNVIPIVGEPLVLKIININRLAYDVSIKSSDVAIVDENFNDEFKTASKFSSTSDNLNIVDNKVTKQPVITVSDFKNPNDANQEIKDTRKSNTLRDSIKNYEGKIKENKNKILTLIRKIGELNSNISTDEIKNNEDSLKTNETKINENNPPEPNKEEELKNAKDDLLKYENLKIDADNQLIDLKNTVDAVQLTFNRLKERYNEILNKYHEIRTNEFDYQDYRQCVLNPLLIQEKYAEKIEDKDFIYYKLFKYRSNLSDFDKSIAFFNSVFYFSMNDWKTLDKLNENAKDNLRTKYQQIKDEVDKIKNAYDELDLATKLLKVEAIHTILKEPKAFIIASAPIEPFEDYVTFDVEIKHRDAKRLAEYDDNRKFTYMEYTQGGVRFDFSTGVVFNFGGNNNEYEIKDIRAVAGSTGGNEKQIVLTSKNNFTPMLAGMFHTSFRRSGIWAFGLTLGASLNVETFQLNSLFPGLSVLIGKKQKFIFTAGPSFRQVDVLKDNYKVGINYESGAFTDSSQLTAQQFKIGGFFGITYNLTQKQKGNFKINGAE
jgi:hypothetical protein